MRSGAMQVERATSVPEVLSIEPRQREPVCVIDHDLGREVQPLPRVEPALAQIAVFGRGQRERLVESAQLEKVVARHDEVVRGKESAWCGVLAEVLVQVVDDALTRSGAQVVTQHVDYPSAVGNGARAV